MRHLVVLLLVCGSLLGCKKTRKEPEEGAAPVIPADWKTCASDAECTFVGLGCCDVSPVNRAHADAAQRQLSESGRHYCPVRAACGPGPGGTWAGAPGGCQAGVCAFPPYSQSAAFSSVASFTFGPTKRRRTNVSHAMTSTTPRTPSIPAGN